MLGVQTLEKILNVQLKTSSWLIYGNFDEKRLLQQITDYDKKSKIILIDCIKENLSSIKEIIKNLYIYNDSRFVIIIYNIELLSLNINNALLKITEEPPQRTIFIFLAEKFSSLIVTLRSRCKRIFIPPSLAGDKDRSKSELRHLILGNANKMNRMLVIGGAMYYKNIVLAYMQNKFLPNYSNEINLIFISRFFIRIIKYINNIDIYPLLFEEEIKIFKRFPLSSNYWLKKWDELLKEYNDYELYKLPNRMLAIIGY